MRRLAYEAADSSLLSPELAAGIRRVKGVKQLGSRLGNRLSTDQASCSWKKPTERIFAAFVMMGVLLGCGSGRSELSALKVEDAQNRQAHWVIVDLVGKGGM